MENELNKVIGNYLHDDTTDYAILINGSWGCGKSFYLSHGFKEFVTKEKHSEKKIEGRSFWSNKETETEDVFFKPAFISLYGVSSVEDFQYRVFLGLNEWVENKFFGTVLRMGSKYLESKGFTLSKGDVDNFTWINSETVLVFDDFERACFDKISPKEILGLINEYSERKQRKVIIVCNEEAFEDTINVTSIEGELSDNGNKKSSLKAEMKEVEGRETGYWDYKEKTIRYTYTYEADINSVYDKIAEGFKKCEFRAFLSKFKPLILVLFEIGGKKNLRTLKFFMDLMLQIHSNVPDNKYKDQILRTLVITSMIYVTEYKKGVSIDELLSMKEKYEIDLDPIFYGLGKEKTAEENPESAKIRYGSFYSNEMIQAKSIVYFLASGYLNSEELSKTIEELHEQYKKSEVRMEYQLYQELCAFNSVNDEDVIEKLAQLINNVKEGKYNCFEIMNIYALLVKYHCFKIGFVLNETTEDVFVSALDAQKEKWTYVSDLPYRIPMWDDAERGSEAYIKYNKLKQHLFEINLQSRNRAINDDCNEFLSKAESGDVNAIRLYRENADKRISLSGIDWDRICKVLDKGSNAMACELADCLQFLLPDSNYIKPADVDPIKNSLQKWLSEYATKEDKRIRKIYILQLKRHIDAILE